MRSKQFLLSVIPYQDLSILIRQIADLIIIFIACFLAVLFIGSGDGINEMITIEPFHGEILNIYKKQPNGWSLRFSDSLSFGHGLSSGLFNENPVVVVGNRSGSIALEIFTVSDLSKGIVNRKVIEENAGPTQTQVFSYNSTDYILSANQRKNEVALYTGTLD